MRARDRHAVALRRLIVTILVAALPTLGSCRTTRGATEKPVFLGDDRDLQSQDVSPAYREQWDKLQAARQRDPADPEVLEAAEALLARDPPLPVRLSAMQALVEYAYATGDDATAVIRADEALSLVEFDPRRPPKVAVMLTLARVRALARGGDPARAVVALQDPVLNAREGLTVSERHGLLAVASQRNADLLQAIVSFAQWRESLPDTEPAAAYAEDRILALSLGFDGKQIAQQAEGLEPSPARACLMARADPRSNAPGASAPAWVQRCHRGAHRIGVLLPRTGPLSALADTQLAAASVAIDVLEIERGVAFRDAGSTPQQAVAAARALVADGADVLVGPVGPSNVRAVARGLGGRVAMVVPGESVGTAAGVAPTLESRIAALVRRAKALDAKRVVVAAPENSYGDRAVKAIKAKVQGKFDKALIIQRYPPKTTSFAPTLAPLLPALTKGAVLMVPDHVARVELLVRQLARSGSNAAVVMTTAEGAGPDAFGRGHEVMDGLWVAPAAAEGAATRAFVRAYGEAQNEPPGDQALLVFYALRRALLGEAAGGAAAAVVRVEDGRLVPPG